MAVVHVAPLGAGQDGREECRLEWGDLGRGLAEVVPRGWPNAVEPRPELDGIEVQLKNALFGQDLFQVPDQKQFLQFARQCLLLAEQQVLHHLHGDGRGAQPEPVVFDVAAQGRLEPRRHPTAVLKEPRVLGSHDGVDEVRRHLGKRHEVRIVRPHDERHDFAGAVARRLGRNLHGLYQRFVARKSDDLGGSLDHLTAVNADLASQVQRVEIG